MAVVESESYVGDDAGGWYRSERWDFAAVAADYSGGAGDVHHCVYRSDEYFVGVAADQSRFGVGSGAGGECGRDFLLGISGAADSRWAPGEILESEEIHQCVARVLGGVRGWVRVRADVSRDADFAVAARRGGERRVSGDVDFDFALVLESRAGAGECVVAVVLAGRGDRVVAVFGMDARSLELARDADCRRRAAVCVADHLASFYSGSSERCKVAAGGGTRAGCSDASSGSEQPRRRGFEPIVCCGAVATTGAFARGSLFLFRRGANGIAVLVAERDGRVQGIERAGDGIPLYAAVYRRGDQFAGRGTAFGSGA